MKSQKTNGLSETKHRLLSDCLRGKIRLRPEQNSRAVITNRKTGGIVPQSWNQEQIWTHLGRIGDKPAYNEPITIYRHGPLDLHSLERALDEIVRRHEIWRTTFAMGQDFPVQIVHATAAPVSLRLFDLRSRKGTDRKNGSERLATANSRENFNLSILPLWRAVLAQVDDEEFLIHLNLHHLLADGFSIYRILVPELISLYEAFSQGRPSPLREPEIQYGDFCVWQRAHLTPQELAPHLDWWKAKLAGQIPRLSWPSRGRRPAVQSFRGATEVLFMQAQLVNHLRKFAERESSTMFMVLVAGFLTLLNRYTREHDFIIGIPSVARKPETEGTMGYFANPLPIRVDLSGDPSFREALLRVRVSVVEALEHGSVPFTYILQKINPPWDPSRSPLFQIMISLQASSPSMHVGWDVVQAEASSGSVKLDLYLNLEMRPNGLRAAVAYSTDLLKSSGVRRMFAEWQSIMESGIKEPERPISQLKSRKRSVMSLTEWLKDLSFFRGNPARGRA